MKPALLDLNVLVALAWPSHIHHQAAHDWFSKESCHGWATCPITQTGLVRLSSNVKILVDAVSPMDAVGLLTKIIALPQHQFWQDSISLGDAAIFQRGYLLGHRQITDAYLLSLAIHNNGRLVSFDKGIQALDKAAAKSHLFILES